MSIGTSGRIVLEIDPLIKRQLYANLATEGITLKEWFLKNAYKYIDESNKNSNYYNLSKRQNETN